MTEQSTNIFNHAATLLFKMRDPALKNIEETQLNSQAYSTLILGCLDAIWASVHGLDSGLLPIDYQLIFLKTTISEGK
jgi:hypothetical protein